MTGKKCLFCGGEMTLVTLFDGDSMRYKCIRVNCRASGPIATTEEQAQEKYRLSEKVCHRCHCALDEKQIETGSVYCDPCSDILN